MPGDVCSGVVHWWVGADCVWGVACAEEGSRLSIDVEDLLGRSPCSPELKGSKSTLCL